MRVEMYVRVMCFWTCVLVCLLVFSFTLSPSLFLVIVFLLDCTISDSLHRKYAQSFTVSTLSQDIGVAGKRREQQRVREDRRGGGLSFFSSPRALLFQKCLGLHSSTSAPRGLSAAS